MNKIFAGSSAKSKKLFTKNTYLMQAFHFSYAGICDCYICSSGSKYRVITSGFKIENDVLTFSKDTTCIFPFNKLYYAISFFNKIMNVVSSSMDWYQPDCLDDMILNDMINEDVFK